MCEKWKSDKMLLIRIWRFSGSLFGVCVGDPHFMVEQVSRLLLICFSTCQEQKIIKEGGRVGGKSA